jgi:hypothetical protein
VGEGRARFQARFFVVAASWAAEVRSANVRAIRSAILGIVSTYATWTGVATPELLSRIYRTRARSRKTRQAVRERRERTTELMARASQLLGRFERLESTPKHPQRPNPKNKRKSQSNIRDESLLALKKSLSDLESIKMTRPDDLALQDLKADISKTIARVEAAPSVKRRARKPISNLRGS